MQNGNDQSADVDSGSAKDSGVAETSQESQLRSSPCPVCKKMSVHRYRPFCSRHCADVDLARWLGGRYAIPARPGDEDIEE